MEGVFIMLEDRVTWLRPAARPVDCDAAAFYMSQACAQTEMVTLVEPDRLPDGWTHAGFITQPYYSVRSASVSVDYFMKI